MEAQPLLYQRPIKLSSQTKLFDWIDRSCAPNLRQVRHLSLQLTDIDLSPLLMDRSQNSQPNARAPTAWSLYENELARFDAALRSLPGLTEITLAPPKVMHSQLLRGMYLSLLALIPRLHPSLKLLVVHDDEAILDVVKALQGIPKVIFKNSQPAAGGAGGKLANGEAGSKKSPSPRSTKSPRGRSTKVKTESGDS
ncbi:hypothetical protein Q7P37_003559 [Cladosporium fusiforme]